MPDLSDLSEPPGGLEATDQFLIARPGVTGDQPFAVTTSDIEEFVAAIVSAVTPATFLQAMTQIASSLPTALPGTSGVLWNNNGVIQIS